MRRSAAAGLDGVFGITHEVDENLEHLVLVHLDERDGLVVAIEGDAVAGQGPIVHAHGVFEQIARRQPLDHARHAGVTLLHGDDLLDVLDIAGDALHLPAPVAMLRLEVLGQLDDEVGELLAARIAGDEFRGVGGVRLEQGGDVAQVAEAGVGELLVEDGGGDVDAVEDVADVVQHAGGDLGHAGGAGKVHERLLGLGQLGHGLFLGLDLLLQLAGSLLDADFESVAGFKERIADLLPLHGRAQHVGNGAKTVAFGVAPLAFLRAIVKAEVTPPFVANDDRDQKQRADRGSMTACSGAGSSRQSAATISPRCNAAARRSSPAPCQRTFCWRAA